MPSSHLIPHAMHLLYSQPCQNPLQPSVHYPSSRATNTTLHSHQVRMRQEGLLASGFAASPARGCRPSNILQKLCFICSSVPSLHHRELTANGLVLALQNKNNLNISEYLRLTLLLHQGGQLSVCPHGPSSRLQTLHAWFDPAGLCSSVEGRQWTILFCLKHWQISAVFMSNKNWGSWQVYSQEFLRGPR